MKKLKDLLRFSLGLVIVLGLIAWCTYPTDDYHTTWIIVMQDGTAERITLTTFRHHDNAHLSSGCVYTSHRDGAYVCGVKKLIKEGYTTSKHDFTPNS